ncbi:MAG TPA: DegT/DnrJ/EryC1/StrS family aminotransferase, partial [Magnetovibrio sp.]
QDDEVIMPAVTFVATANAAAYLKAIPHFADSTEENFGIDVERLSKHLSAIALRQNDQVINRQTGRRIAAVVCMHTFGHPVDLDPLVELCKAYDLPLIEDAAEALGSTYKGRHVGNHGLMSAFSFNGNKITTTGGGGMLVTNDAELAARARHLSSTAKTPHRWEFYHDETGYNYRMPNLNAALGCAQLERLDDMLAAKRALAAHYIETLSGIDGIDILAAPGYGESNYWLNALVLKPENASLRDPLLGALNDNTFASRPLWNPMHLLPMYQDCPRMDLSVAESLFHRTINLPSSARLGRNISG